MSEQWQVLSRELLTSPFLLLMLMIGVFELSVWLRNRTGQALINPTLTTTVVVIAVLMMLDIDWASFERASNYITFWLQPVAIMLSVLPPKTRTKPTPVTIPTTPSKLATYRQ